MKKFISMLAGVVMASSLFAVSAYAANVSATADKTEVVVGEKVVVTIDSAAKSVATDTFYLEFDKDMFTVDTILNNKGKESFTLNWWDDVEEMTMANKYSYTSVAEANNGGAVSFWYVGTDPVAYSKKAGFAVITFTAKKAGDASFTLVEDSAGGDNANKGTATELNVKVTAPVVDDEPTWTAASSEWAAPAGKKAIWWGFDFAAGEFAGHQFITVTDGAEVPTTKTVGVGAVDGYDIDGAVSFAVAVILDEDVDAAKFDAYVGK